MEAKEVGKIIHVEHGAYKGEYVVSPWTVQRQQMERDLRMFMEDPELAADRAVALKEAYRMAEDMEKERNADWTLDKDSYSDH